MDSHDDVGKLTGTLNAPIEQGMIIEGELIQTSSEKCLTPSDHPFLMASSRSGLFRRSRGEGSTIGLGEDSVERV